MFTKVRLLIGIVLFSGLGFLGQAQEIEGMSDPTPPEFVEAGASNPVSKEPLPSSNIQSLDSTSETSATRAQEIVVGSGPLSTSRTVEVEVLRDPFESVIKSQIESKPPQLEEESGLGQKTDRTADPDEIGGQSDAPPIESSFNPFTQFLLREYQLQAILWNVKEPKAIYKSPNGELVKVKIGYRLGREGGVIWKIREKEVLSLIPYLGDFKNARVYTHRMLR